MPAPVRLGVSAAFFDADSQRAVFKGKVLLYVEQSLAHWCMHTGALLVLLPTVPAPLRLRQLLQHVDGLILQGGSDVCPRTYGEEPLNPLWSGDAVRDAYEIELLRESMDLNKPVLGVCRGAQVINVGLGGTLYQDIETQRPQAHKHRNWDIYDQHFHAINVLPDTGLASLYPGQTTVRVNSVHHQAVKDLAPGLRVEAVAQDGVIEAVRWTQSAEYVLGVQWHPEYQDPSDPSLMPAQPILDEFLRETARRR
jgi:putative glutamine amidotransferase